MKSAFGNRRVHDKYFFRTFSVVFNCRSLCKEAAYLAALRRVRSPFAIHDADSKQSKTKIYEKTHLLWRILAVIGRYGPHLMIVMIFVTQNNIRTLKDTNITLTFFRKFCYCCFRFVGPTLDDSSHIPDLK